MHANMKHFTVTVTDEWFMKFNDQLSAAIVNTSHLSNVLLVCVCVNRCNRLVL